MDVIIGADITGLSYAMFAGNMDYRILENDNSIGGYCRTTNGTDSCGIIQAISFISRTLA